MKVFILVIIMMLPNGKGSSVMYEVAECPPYEEVSKTIEDMKKQQIIVDAVAACKPVTIARRA